MNATTSLATRTAEPSDDTLSLIYRHARRKAAWLVKRAGFPQSDREDIEQELVLHLLGQMEKYDPKQGTLNAFVREVLFTYAGEMLRRRERRQDCCTITLLPMPEMVRVSDEQTTSQPNAPDHEHVRIEVGDFLETLPPTLRELCERLKTQSWRAALQAMGFPYHCMPKLQQELQERFAEAGFSPSSLTV